MNELVLVPREVCVCSWRGEGGDSAQSGGVHNLPSPHCSTSQSPPLSLPFGSFTMLPLGRNSYSSQTTTLMVNVKTLYETSILIFLFSPLLHHPLIEPNPNVQVCWKKNSESPSRVERKSGRLNMAQKVEDFLASLGVTTLNFGFPLVKLGGS